MVLGNEKRFVLAELNSGKLQVIPCKWLNIVENECQFPNFEDEANNYIAVVTNVDSGKESWKTLRIEQIKGRYGI